MTTDDPEPAESLLAATRALETAERRIEELSSKARRLELIHGVGRALIEAPDLESAMGRVVGMVAGALGCVRVAVSLEGREPGEPGIIVASGRARGDGGGGSELTVPVAFGGAVLGAVTAEREGGAFGPDDVALLEQVVFYAAAAIDAWRLRGDADTQSRVLDDRTRRFDLLHRVSRSLTGRMSLDELLDELLRLCAEAFELRHVALLLLEEDGRTLALKAEIGYDARAPRRLAIDEGITGHVAVTGVPVLIPDVTKDPRYVTGVSGGRAEMAVPLKVHGRLLGVLDAESAEVGGFDEEDLDLFTSFAAQAAIAIRGAELQARLEAGGGVA